MDPLVAELTLAEVRAAQRRTRRRAAAVRFPLGVIGAATLVAGAWTLAVGRDHLAVFYAPALLITAVAAGWRYRRISLREGEQASISAWAVTAFVLLVLAASVSRISDASDRAWLNEAGPSLVFAVGYLGLGAWGRNRVLILVAAVMIADSLLAPLMWHGDRCVAWQLAIDGALLIVAAVRTQPVRLSA